MENERHVCCEDLRDDFTASIEKNYCGEWRIYSIYTPVLPEHITIRFCPFCGKKLDKENEATRT